MPKKKIEEAEQGRRVGASEKIVIEVLEKGLLDLRHAGILAHLLWRADTDKDNCGCVGVCDCKSACGCKAVCSGVLREPTDPING
jgi:hypothetical protein